MATPADQRLLELLDKWLKSLELHIRYSSLDSDSYWKIQPWPEHQRPSRWIIDLAMQKAAALRTQVQERVKQGDNKFSDSLELMTFLANLIGSEHIERFIPLADAENERDLKAAATAAAPPPLDATTGTRQMPQFVALEHGAEPEPAASPARARPPAPAAAPAAAANTATGTREMPHFGAKRQPNKPAQSAPDSATTTREMPEFSPSKRRAPAPVGTAHVARTERKSPEPKPSLRPTPKQPAKMANPGDSAREQVIADAARLVQWGRKWYELAELIARMADRPPLAEVRRILKDNKTAIEKKAGGS
jgi:hypothetical protein